MREVTKTEFYAAIGPLDVHPRITTTGSDFEHRQTRQLAGRTEGVNGHYWDGEHKYFLAVR